MASVTLKAVWFHSPTDLSDVLVLRHVQWSETYKPDAELREYAGGVLRTVSTPTILESLAVTIPHVSRADWHALRARTGIRQMMRDSRDRVWWGIISGLTGDEFRSQDVVATVSFVFLRDTHTEVV